MNENKDIIETKSGKTECQKSKNKSESQYKSKSKKRRCFICRKKKSLSSYEKLENSDVLRDKIKSYGNYIHEMKLKKDGKKKALIAFTLFIPVSIFIILLYVYSINSSIEKHNGVGKKQIEIIESFISENRYSFTDIDGNTIEYIIDTDGVIYLADKRVDEIVKINFNTHEDISEDFHGIFVWFILLTIAICGVIIFFFEYFLFESLVPYQERLINYQEEAELEELKANASEPAYINKQFIQHQRELKRYYDHNLEHSRSLLILGGLLIVFGVVIVITTFVVSVNYEAGIVPIVLGSISGLVVDFIGYIFVRMYSRNLDASIKYHEKLTVSNNLLLSNVATSRIEDKECRDKSYANIALEIAKIKV